MKKITKAHIASLMTAVTYHVYAIENTTTTVAVAFDANGFSLATGISACADPELFDEKLGEKYALEDAERKAEQELWKLEGYRLKCELAEKENRLTEVGDLPKGFSLFESKPIFRKAIQIKNSGELFAQRCLDTAQNKYRYREGDDISVSFVAHEEVLPGDYIVFLNDKDTYHCKQSVFLERNHL